MKKVKEGYKMTEIGEIPSEWKVKKLGEITIGKGEYGIGASATEYIEGKPRYLRITDIGDSCRLLFNEIKGLDDADYEKYILKEGDIVFARTGNTTGKGYVYNKQHGELVYAGFLIKYSIDNNIAKHNFIKYVIQSKRYWDWVNIMSTRSGQPGINSNEYSSFIVQLPPLKEQEKIASIISTVDEQIDNVNGLIEKNKELKKGLMQKLLTKGIGHTKFKNTEIGEIPEEWEVKSLEQVCDIVDYRGKTPEKVDKGILLITAKNINKGFIDYNVSREYVKENDYEKVMSRGVPQKGDVLFTTEAPLGNVANVDDENIALAQRVIKFRGNEEYLDNYFLKYYMLGDTFQIELLRQATGSTVLGIKGSRLKKLLIAIPNRKEQKKIASILSELDKKIEQYENKQQKLEQLKKGLMQQLLTGKIRVL